MFLDSSSNRRSSKNKGFLMQQSKSKSKRSVSWRMTNNRHTRSNGGTNDRTGNNGKTKAWMDRERGGLLAWSGHSRVQVVKERRYKYCTNITQKRYKYRTNKIQISHKYETISTNVYMKDKSNTNTQNQR